jgi:hypothetical protein
MTGQQLIVLLAVSIAAAYLGRNLWHAWLRFRSADKGGCASGCGKCAYAAEPAEQKSRKSIAVMNANKRE